jgi:hypothetical protein
MTGAKRGTMDDGSRGQARRGSAGPRPRSTLTKPKVRDESDLGSDIQGNNALQGDDQGNRRNQRQTTPDEG